MHGGQFYIVFLFGIHAPMAWESLLLRSGKSYNVALMACAEALACGRLACAWE
jgi:hypothetical protein